MMATTTSSARRRIVLHFDLNRTVLMSDAAGGRTIENTVDYLLSECTWGYVHPHKPAEWVCVSDASSIEPPSGGVASVALDGESVTVPLITYKQFVDDSHPYKSLQRDAADGSSIEQIKAFNKAAKKQRTALQSAFTGGDGPGARVRASFDDVMAKLHFPEGELRDAAKDAASTLPPSRLQEAWHEGKFYLLPSFLQLLTFLAARSSDREFRLVFRTFGDDIPEVAKELELLVAGAHPWNRTGMAPLPRSFALDVSPRSRSVGTFYRDGYGADGTALAVGTLTKLPFSTANQSDAQALERFYGQANGGDDSTGVAKAAEIVRGFGAIDRTLATMLREHSTLALRDYWEWWSAHAENGEYGKLLLVHDAETARDGGDSGDVATTESSDADRDVAIFFDDHIEAHHAHIVDVRDVRSGRAVAFKMSKRKYLQRVEPFAAITDANYFVALVEQILRDADDDASKL